VTRLHRDTRLQSDGGLASTTSCHRRTQGNQGPTGPRGPRDAAGQS